MAKSSENSPTVPPPPSSETVPEDIPLEALFEDEHLIVVNKPAGMVVHPAAGNPDGTLVNALLDAEVMDTGEVREADQRGRHTTVAAQLLRLNSVSISSPSSEVPSSGHIGTAMWPTFTARTGCGTAQAAARTPRGASGSPMLRWTRVNT